MVVRVGVIHQLVAAFDDGFRLLGVLIRPVAHDEKGARYAVLAQHVKNFLRVVRAPGCIERDGADLLVALHTVDGQLPRCSRRTDGGRIIDGGILRVNMANIRRKIEKNPASPEYIFTEIGVGYRMLENEA